MSPKAPNGPREVSSPTRRLDLNQQLFREVNNRIRALSVRQLEVPWTERTRYLCECSDVSCIETVELTLDEYESLRQEPDLRAVLPGHESSSSEVVATSERYLIVVSKDAD